MNEAYKNIITRRSVRTFTSETIKLDDLKEIVKAGTYAPSGMNKQSWQFTAITDRNIISKIEKAIENNLNRPNYSMYNSNCIILLSNDRENTNGLADCACALENIFLAAHSIGIGSVWINQLKTICDCSEVREILNSLNIPDTHIVWGVAALGYAASEAPEPKPRTAIVNYF